MEENIMDEVVEKVDGEVVNEIVEGSTEEAKKILLEVSDDLGDSMSKLAKGVAGLAVFGLATAVAGAGYGIYKGAKFLKGKMNNVGKKSKKSKKDEADPENQAEVEENTEAVETTPEVSKKDTSSKKK